MDNIEQQVKKVVAEQLSINEADIKDDSAFIADLGADSLDTVELVMALEDNFGIEIPDEQQEKIQTVQDAIDFLINKSTSRRVECEELSLPASVWSALWETTFKPAGTMP